MLVTLILVEKSVLVRRCCLNIKVGKLDFQKRIFDNKIKECILGRSKKVIFIKSTKEFTFSGKIRYGQTLNEIFVQVKKVNSNRQKKF